MKEFHVWNFPDSIYVKFNNSFRKQLYSRLLKLFGSTRKIGKALGGGLSLVTIIRRGKDYEGLEAYLNVKFVKKIIQFLPELKNAIEKNIVAYRCRAGWSVYKPILPIKESPEVYNIISHLICDGSAGKRKTPYYCNTNKELREEFKRNLQVFGNVEINEKVMHHNVYGAMFPKAVSDVLAHCFQVRFVYPDKFPDAIFTATDECKKILLRALFDDEGCVSNGSLSAVSASKNMIIQARKLLESLEIKKTSIDKVGRCFQIRILASDQKRFESEIGLSHPRKIKLLTKFNMRRSIRKEQPERIKKLIFDFLETPKTINEIACIIDKEIGATRKYLLKLKEDGKVKSEMAHPNKPWKWLRNNL